MTKKCNTVLDNGRRSSSVNVISAGQPPPLKVVPAARELAFATSSLDASQLCPAKKYATVITARPQRHCQNGTQINHRESEDALMVRGSSKREACGCSRATTTLSEVGDPEIPGFTHRLTLSDRPPSLAATGKDVSLWAHRSRT